MISDYLVEAVSRLQYRYNFKKFYLVAHSMGGLVSRSFVKRYIDRNPSNLEKIGLVMTINSPMAGMQSASSGVKYSPIVVPSWRDITPKSSLIAEINNWDWPDEIPYHLVISYLEGESSDGVVPLASQANLKLQREAKRIYLFNAEHTNLLNNKKFHVILNEVLNSR